MGTTRVGQSNNPDIYFPRLLLPSSSLSYRRYSPKESVQGYVQQFSYITMMCTHRVN
jgi:hypothetical protein